jgi:hypothetical protein
MEQSYTTIDPWTYRDSDTLGVDVTRALELVGFEVEAIDGEIGKIDEAIQFARPAGAVRRVEAVGRGWREVA